MKYSSQPSQWRVPVAVSMFLVAGGLFLTNATLVAVAMAPLVFVAASALTTVPSLAQVSVSRTVTPQQTYPGGTATVELTVTNDSEQAMSELRVIDGVPDALGVVDGSPRAATRLESGESTTIVYTIRLQHGEHDFRSTTLRTQDLSGTHHRHTERDATGDDSVLSRIGLEGSTAPDATIGVAGPLATDIGGEGIEFYGIRSYNPGDPVTRINWRQYARDRKLSTVEYKRREAAETILIIDARSSTRVAPNPTAPTGAESGLQAAAEVARNLLITQHRVGLIILTTVHPDANDGWLWVPPGTADATRIQSALDAAATGAETPQDQPSEPDPPVESVVRDIQQSASQAQILLFSPLTDAYPIELCTMLDRTKRHCSVYAPVLSTQQSTGGTVEAAAHEVRVHTLRARGIPVVTWTGDQQSSHVSTPQRGNHPDSTTSTQQ